MKLTLASSNDPLSRFPACAAATADRPQVGKALTTASSQEGKEYLPVQAPSPLGEGWEGGIIKSNYVFYPSLRKILRN